MNARNLENYIPLVSEYYLNVFKDIDYNFSNGASEEYKLLCRCVFSSDGLSFDRSDWDIILKELDFKKIDDNNDDMLKLINQITSAINYAEIDMSEQHLLYIIKNLNPEKLTQRSNGNKCSCLFKNAPVNFNYSVFSADDWQYIFDNVNIKNKSNLNILAYIIKHDIHIGDVGLELLIKRSNLKLTMSFYDTVWSDTEQVIRYKEKLQSTIDRFAILDEINNSLISGKFSQKLKV